MKKILITILVLVSIQSFGQIKKKYAERLNADLTIDSFYHKWGTDSLFNYSNDQFVSFTLDYYRQNNLIPPNNFGNFHKTADGIFKNFAIFAESIHWDGVNNKPSTFPATASTVGANLLSLTTPASISLPRINADGTVGTRTLAQVTSDLGIDLKANINSPAFTGTPTGIGIPVYAWVNGANVTTTGQVLVNITGLSVPLAINARYEFEVVLSVSTTAVTTGTGYGINYSAAGAAIEAHITGSLTSTASKTVRINALNTAATPYLTTSGQTGGIRIRGMITTGANAGDLTVSHRKETSGTSTIFSNSYIKVTRIQ